MCACVFVFKWMNTQGLCLTQALKALLVEPIRPLLNELWTGRQTDARNCSDSSSFKSLCCMVCGCSFQRSVTSAPQYICIYIYIYFCSPVKPEKRHRGDAKPCKILKLKCASGLVFLSEPDRESSDGVGLDPDRCSFYIWTRVKSDTFNVNWRA